MADGSIGKTDRERIIDALKELQRGGLSGVSFSELEDRELASEFEKALGRIRKTRNSYLTRVNDAMRRQSDGSSLRRLLDRVDEQHDSIKSLHALKDRLRFSMRLMEEYGFEMLAVSRQIRNTCEPCVDDMRGSYAEIKDLVDELKSTVEEISLGFLTLDAELPPEVYDIIDKFLLMMNKCTSALENRGDTIHETTDSLEAIEARVQSVIADVESINSLINEQNLNTGVVLDGVEHITESSEAMTLECYSTGRHQNRVTREMDLIRSDLIRGNIELGVHDLLRIFEVDHLLYVWNLYSHIMEMDTLKDSDFMKGDDTRFFQWCKKIREDPVLTSRAYITAVEGHNDVYRHGAACCNARNDFDMMLTRKEFEKTLESYEKFTSGLDELHKLYIKNGVEDVGSVWKNP